MSKKLIFTLIVLAAIIGISFKMNQPPKAEKELNLSSTQDTQNIFESLKKRNIKSIVIFVSDSDHNISQADQLIDKLKKDQSIKVLAFEIYNAKSSEERLMQLGFENGKPDIFYVNKKLIATNDISAIIKTEIQKLSGAKSAQ